MANTWFMAAGEPVYRSAALSTLIRNEFNRLQAAFDKLPDPAGGLTKGFTGGFFYNSTLYNAQMQGGAAGSASNPAVVVALAQYLGAGAGYAAGALPVESGTLGAFFRMATTTRVGYARSNSGTPVTSFFFDQFRSFVMGDGANVLDTTATEGFLYLSSCAGTPTGAPAAYTGAAPIVVDTSANRLWVQIAGTWRYAALT
jgi:hypothetical protein